MARKNYTPEQIIKRLREVEIYLGKGNNVAQTCRKIGVSEQTFRIYTMPSQCVMTESSMSNFISHC